ncbi:hypothetical protein [Cellulomonas sp. ATA003]|uniref:hypothetical protein n=1 Tax=Cellulomonas sp. ATA003 TaxID=3073064 RepID=UPI002872FE20|nr:hypothetical protein [Cellulomonas sp. ATA003]WNB84589.1 hypothetical protein REH70_12250 [Cellulomonas sp. ATA003]
MRRTLLTSAWRLAIVLGLTFALLMVVARWIADGGVTAGDLGVAAVSGLGFGALMGPWTARAGARARRQEATPR